MRLGLQFAITWQLVFSFPGEINIVNVKSYQTQPKVIQVRSWVLTSLVGAVAGRCLNIILGVRLLCRVCIFLCLERPRC